MFARLLKFAAICRCAHSFLAFAPQTRLPTRNMCSRANSRLHMSTQAAKPPQQGELELLCKAGPGGKTLGDCPFAHYVSMALHAKDIPFKLTPLASDAKPTWLVEGFEGKMPCLVHKGEAYTESSTIVKYLEFFFPEPPLAPKELQEEIDAATLATNGLFGVLAKYLKNVSDKEADAELLKAVQHELKSVDEHLQKTGGPYLCGKQLTLVDCSFAPKLYHAKVGLAQFKNQIIPPELEALHRYMSMIFAHPAFEASSYSPTAVVAGWNQARGTGAK